MMLQAQLDVLEQCGIVPRRGIGVPELLVQYREREYETAPFHKLLIALGNETKDSAPSALSDTVWHARASCISGPGDYVHVAMRMSALTQGVLCLGVVSDEFDLRRGVAWLRFRSADAQYQWPARLREHWLDPAILSRFVRLLGQQDTDRRFTVLDLGGQDYLLGCSTPQQFRELRRFTGLIVEWLG